MNKINIETVKLVADDGFLLTAYDEEDPITSFSASKIIFCSTEHADLYKEISEEKVKELEAERLKSIQAEKK